MQIAICYYYKVLWYEVYILKTVPLSKSSKKYLLYFYLHLDNALEITYVVWKKDSEWAYGQN